MPETSLLIKKCRRISNSEVEVLILDFDRSIFVVLTRMLRRDCQSPYNRNESLRNRLPCRRGNGSTWSFCTPLPNRLVLRPRPARPESRFDAS